MHCPKCRALQRKGSGYPDPGIADLDLCHPDELCPSFEGPVEYACRLLSEEDQEQGLSHFHQDQIFRLRSWTGPREKRSQLSYRKMRRETLQALLKEKAADRDMMLVYKKARVRGRLRPCFFLRHQEEPRRQILSDLI